jgi:hypothetical protein
MPEACPWVGASPRGVWSPSWLAGGSGGSPPYNFEILDGRSQILIWSHPKLECIRSYRFPVMNKKPWCQDVILTSTGVFSVCHGIVSRFQFCGILTAAWISSISHWDQRGTKIHPKKPAFLRPIKSFIFLKYMPRLHLLPSRISKFSGGGHPDPVLYKKKSFTILVLHYYMNPETLCKF